MNQEYPDVHARCRKGRGIRDQIASIHWIIEKARGLHKKKFSALLIMLKPSTVDHSKLWKSPKEMGIPYSLTSLLRKLGQGVLRTRHRTDWFKTRKVA